MSNQYNSFTDRVIDEFRDNGGEEIETGDEGTIAVHVSELKGVERDAAWARFTEHSSGFRDHEAKTTRTIPVLALTRR